MVGWFGYLTLFLYSVYTPFEMYKVEFMGGWFFMPEVVAAAIQYGLATQQQFDDTRAALEEWSRTAGAVGGIAFGECTASKPLP